MDQDRVAIEEPPKKKIREAKAPSALRVEMADYNLALYEGEPVMGVHRLAFLSKISAGRLTRMMDGNLDVSQREADALSAVL